MSGSSIVDRLANQRSWISMVLGAFVLAKSSSLFVFEASATGLQVTLTDGLSTMAWLIWVAILLLFALFAGGLWLSAPLRRRLNDEGTMANWRSAISAGFWAMMVGAAICMLASDHMPLTVPGAVQVMISLGVGMALMRFGGLERNALR